MRSVSRILLATSVLLSAGSIGLPAASAQGPVVGLPYTTMIAIGPPGPCESCPPALCPGQAIPVRLAGDFMTNCLKLVGVRLVPPMEAGPLPYPPSVLITVATNDCMGWPCDLNPNPWSAGVIIPPLRLPPDAYQMRFTMQVVSMCDSTRIDATYVTALPFTVRDSCTAPPERPCVYADWDHSMRGDESPCDGYIGADGTARVSMTVRSGVPLAGLQGRLSTFPPGLRIAGLEPIGPAQGMHLAWQPTPDGATFVMFADQGAPIPGGVRCAAGTRCIFQVLGVTLASDSSMTPAPLTHVTAGELLGADSLGAAVPECLIQTPVAVSAVVCAGPSCDHNLDGRLDVRDLVAMVHCVLSTGPCPDSSRGPLDCNGDGILNVDDVLCCARAILRGGAPDTLPGRPEPTVGIAVGPGVWAGDGIDVPLSLSGADQVGAARLALSFPAERYEVGAVDLGPFASGWLAVPEVIDGRLVLGLVALGPVAGPTNGGGTELRALVHLRLKPGRTAGGSITLADARFAGRDGATLAVPINPVPAPLPDAGRVELSPPQPSPFVRETRFLLNLERGGEVEFTVHDLSGRLVATLHQGPLVAGPHEFTWRGRRGDGSPLPNGIYFVRALVGGEQLTRKVLLLRGD